MKKIILLTIAFYSTNELFPQFNYPTTKTVNKSDTYFGVTYQDPYRWLENMKEPEVEKWFKEQASFTDNIIDKLSGRDELIVEWQELEKLKPTIYSDRHFCDGKVFYQKKESKETYTKLYYKKGEAGQEELLFDPTSLDKSLHSAIPSNDGKKIILKFTKNGTEVYFLKVFDVNSKLFLADSIYPSAENVYWCNDNKSFIYTSLITDDNNSANFFKNNSVKLHCLGTETKDDINYFSIKGYPELKINEERSPNGKISSLAPNYIFTSIGNDDGKCIYYVALVSQQYTKHISWKILCKAEDQLVNFIDFKGNKVYALSNKNAKNYKLIATNIDVPNWSKAEVIAEEKKDLVLDNIIFCKDYILITYSNGINNKLYKYNFISKQLTEVVLPFSGTINTVCINNNSNTIYVTITSWNKPKTQFELNAITNTFSISDFNKAIEYPEKYKNIEVEEVEVKAHDGEMIPLTIIYKKGQKKTGKSICIIYGYGAYGYSMSGSFDIKLNSLITKGVVFAIPHIRGGGEKGEAWYKGGCKTTKQNTWKDFNSCAEYLISSGFTSTKKIIAYSGSAGGILVSRAIIARPDLYGAAICGSGLINTLRMEQMPNGLNLSGEFGTIKDSIECRALFEMDGLANLKKNIDYPAVICFTGYNDPRVSSWQSAKFIAALQNITDPKKPTLLQVKYDGGHFPSNKVYADYWTFALWQCGHPDFQFKK